MLLNAIVVLLASMGTLIGLRAGIRFALVHELDQILEEDLDEIELDLAAAGDPGSATLFSQLDRKARGHIQHRWFVLILAVDPNGSNLRADAIQRSDSKQRALSNNDNRIWQSVNVPADLTLIDRIIGIAFGLGLVIAPLGGYWLAGRVTRLLSAIINTADRLRPEKLNERLSLRGTGDELDHLSHTLNMLLDRIANFLEKRKDFLANAAHELRTPLAALRSTAEVALRSPRTSLEYQELIGTIVEECQSLEVLVNQLLLLAETESETETILLSGESIDLGELIKKSYEMFIGVAESRSIDLHLQVVQVVKVKGNRHHLRQVVNNLIDNALKFTPEGGSVSLTIDKATGDSKAIFTVKDTGVGIAEEEKPRLFDRFYRGERSRRRDSLTRGTGLGLSICRAIVDGHGGSITVTSQVGQGSSFQVCLPLYDERIGA